MDNPEEPPVVIDLTTRRPDDVCWSLFGGPKDGEKTYLRAGQDVFMVLWGLAPKGRRNPIHGEYRPRSVADEVQKVMRWQAAADGAGWAP
jgi:hypothetical protein